MSVILWKFEGISYRKNLREAVERLFRELGRGLIDGEWPIGVDGELNLVSQLATTSDQIGGFYGKVTLPIGQALERELEERFAVDWHD